MNNNDFNHYPHPEAGEVVAVSVDGQLYINPANKKYMESLSKPKDLKHLEEKALKGTAGFSRKRIVNNKYDEVQKLSERLVLIQNTIARLEKELKQNKKIEAFILEDLKKLGIIINSDNPKTSQRDSH